MTTSQCHSVTLGVLVTILIKVTNVEYAVIVMLLHISEAQLKFVSSSPAGMGLMKCSNIVIPFDNRISKENSLYRIFNTNLHEKAEMEKVKNAVDK